MASPDGSRGPRPSAWLLRQPPACDRDPAVAEAEFSAYYRAELVPLVRFLLCMGARLADAADIAQDTMISAYRTWSTIRYPRAWSRTVASRGYARHLASIEVTIDPADGNPLLPPHVDAADWEERHEVLTVLGRLPARQRQVMAWTFDGFSPTEIATELDVTPESVRSNLRHARRTLARHLSSADRKAHAR